MADSTSILEIVLKAKDEATKTMEGFNKSIENTQKSTLSMSKTFGIVGVALTGIGVAGMAVMNDWTNLASDVEVANAQLEHAVIKVSKATREQFEQTQALADALERKGVLDGDNIKIGLAQLSTFGLSNKAVQALGGSLADLAVNQFGVAASGDQLSQSANMIAKALNGQFGVLEKSGIRFSEAQRKMIEFGTETEKVKAINEGFAQNLKYTNDVARQTASGMKAHLGVQLENIKESLGTSLLPLLAKFTDKLSVLADKINSLDPKQFDAIAKGVLLISGIALVVGPIMTLIAALPALAAGFKILTTTALGPIALIVAAVVLLAFLIITHWSEISAFFVKLWADIVATFQSSVQWIGAQITALGLWFDQMKESVSTKFNEMLVSIGNFIGGVILWFQGLPEGVMMFIRDLFLVKIPFALGFLWGYLSIEIPRIILSIITWFMELPTNIVNIFTEIYLAISNKIFETWTYLSVAIPQLVADVVLWFTGIIAKVGEIFRQVYQWIVTHITAAWTWLSTNVPTWPGKILDFIKSIPEKVSGVFNDAKDAAISKMTELWNGVQAIWEKVKGIFNSIKQAAEDAWNAATKAFNAGNNAGVKGSRAIGGWINETGPYLMHAGEYVLSNAMLNGTQPIGANVNTNSNNKSQSINIASVIVQDISDIDLLGQRLAFQLATSGSI